MSAKIILVKPTVQHKQAILAYRDEFLQNQEKIHGSGDIEHAASFETWLQTCTVGEREETMPKGRVPATQYLAITVSDSKLVGMLQIRHSLNNHLKIQGGHIGYSVRKSERRKGYATQMLGTALIICKQLGIQRVLLTCASANIGSAGVIRANNGVYEKQLTLEDGSKLDHYWVQLAT
jgi:predicted acetyltransferase